MFPCDNCTGLHAYLVTLLISCPSCCFVRYFGYNYQVLCIFIIFLSFRLCSFFSSAVVKLLIIILKCLLICFLLACSISGNSSSVLSSLTAHIYSLLTVKLCHIFLTLRHYCPCRGYSIMNVLLVRYVNIYSTKTFMMIK